MPADPRSLELSQVFADRLSALARTTASSAGALLFGAETTDLDPTFRRFVTAAAGIVRSGQTAAVGLAGGYLRAVGRLEVGHPVDVDTGGIAGRTFDGRHLARGLAATPVKAYLALKQGRPVPDAVAVARASARRFAGTEVMDAGRRVIHQAVADSERIRGWRWRSRGTCEACFALDDGDVRGGGMDTHPNCECWPDPVFDVHETVTPPTGHDRFAGMSKAEQDAALGPERAHLIRADEIPWTALVHTARHRDWRPSVRTASLEDLTRYRRRRHRERTTRRAM